ncbi:hypothetical protein ALQ47_05268 [Pseudomonas cichorii]|nr:hypothetical protein ALQ47_05268 [Pseudomonas cichorii]
MLRSCCSLTCKWQATSCKSETHTACSLRLAAYRSLLPCNRLSLHARFQRTGATVDIFVTLDVVFTQVAARLDFDDFQRDLARVFQAVYRSDRDVGRLVFSQQEHVLVAGNLSRAGYHDPVLGAVVVHLQGEAGARFDRDALDLEAAAHVHRVVGAPRTIDFQMVLGFAAALLVERVDHLLDALDLVLVGDHHGVLGFDDHDVVQTDHRDQFAVAVDHAVAAVLNDDVAFGDVAVAVFFMHFPQRRPAADIAPASRQRHDAGALGFFHDGVVDGVVRAAGEGRRIDVDGTAIVLAALEGQQAGVVDVRIVLFQLFQEAAGAEQEHAAVPVVTACFDEFGSAFFVWLLDEVRDAAHAFRQQGIGGGLDIAITGFRFVGRYAEQNHFATLGCNGGQSQCALQGFLIVDHVIGRQDQHQLVVAFIDQHHRRQGHGGCGVAPERLHQDGLGVEVQCCQLLVYDETMLLVADHDGLLHTLEHQTLQSLLEQSVFACQCQELFRELFTRKRPES